jgi:hypothetical protein
MSDLPEELDAIVTNLSPFQRVYCEYRAKGLKQAEAASRAGSNASDRAARGRIGYAVEQIPGVKDYIFWLQQQRAKVAMIDQVEIIDKLRQIYDASMRNDKFREANVSVELMGKLIGLFGATASSIKHGQETQKDTAEAFKEEEATDNETLARMEKLQQMLKDVNNTRKS